MDTTQASEAPDTRPVLGRDVRHPIDRLDTFPEPEGFSGTVTFTTAEPVPSLCPVTGQPDLTDLTIRYRPGGRCVESKSLKLYLWSFRNEQVFVEAMALRIARRVMEDAAPRWVEVVCDQHTRGGIRTRAEVVLPPADGAAGA